MGRSWAQWLLGKFRASKPRRRQRGSCLQVEILEDRLAPAVLTVNILADTSNAGGGLSLRDAISVVDGTLAAGSLSNAEQLQIVGTLNPPGGDTIAFDIAGLGVRTIALQSALPTISKPVILDGTTQPGYSGTPLIQLDGTSAGSANGLTITAGSTTVKGLDIVHFSGDGINLSTNGGDAINSSYIGVGADGTTLQGNGGNGVTVNNTAGNTIGTSASTTIEYAVGYDAVNGIVFGTVNLRTGIFTEAGLVKDGLGTFDGDLARLPGGKLYGVDSSSNLVIINPATLQSSLVGNVGHGISGIEFRPDGKLFGATSNNLFTVDPTTGFAAFVGSMGNFVPAVNFDLAFVGDTLYLTENNGAATTSLYRVDQATGQATLIGSTGFSLVATDYVNGTLYATTTDSKIISINTTTGAGTLVSSESPAVGLWTLATASPSGNVIGGNTGDGIEITGSSATGNTIQGNSMSSNTALGIGLGGTTFVANDSQGHSGPNLLQDYPVLTRARIDGSGNLRVTFTNPFGAGSTNPIDFYVADANGQGKTYVATTTGSGTVNLGNAAVLGVANGDPLVATATDGGGNTSEFPPAVVASVLSITVTSPGDDPGSPTAGVVTLRDAITQVNNDTLDGTANPDVINFGITGTPTISLAADLPALTNPVLIDGSTQAGVTVNGNAFAMLNAKSVVTVNDATFTGGTVAITNPINPAGATLTVNAGAALSVAGDLTLVADPHGNSFTRLQNHGSVSVSGDVVGDEFTTVNNYGTATITVANNFTADSVSNGNSASDAATISVGGNFTMGTTANRYVNPDLHNYGKSTITVQGNLAVLYIHGAGEVDNGQQGGTSDATINVGGSFSIGSLGASSNQDAQGILKNFGQSTVTTGGDFNIYGIGTSGVINEEFSSFDHATLAVGGSLSILGGYSPFGSFLDNSATGVIKVTDNLTMGDDCFINNGVYNTDAATMTVGGNLTLGVLGSGDSNYVYNQGASQLDVGGSLTLQGAGSYLYNGASSTDASTMTVSGNFTLGVLGSIASSFVYNQGTSQLNVSGSLALQGAGSTLDVSGGTVDLNVGASNPPTTTLIGLTISGGTTNFGNASVNVSGALNWAGGTVTASQVIVSGTAGFSDSTSVLNGSLSVNGSTITSSPGSTLEISGNVLGSTTGAALEGSLLFDGNGTASAPQQLEVMSQDLGNTAAGFTNNDAFETLALRGTTYVQLVDQSANTNSGSPEALYVNNVVVPAGCTLDLNGLHVYTRVLDVLGTVVNGTINVAPPGPLPLDSPASGTISAATPVNSWTFVGQAIQPVSIVVQTGNQGTPPSPIAPMLNYAQVQLLDSMGHVVATATNSVAGTDIDILAVLPADGTYTIQVEAPPGAPGSVGHYNITLTNAVAPTFTADTPTVARVGSAFSYQFQASGTAPITYSAANLPSWAQLDPSTGILSGTPTVAGIDSLSVTASNGVAPAATVDVTLIMAGGSGGVFDVPGGTTVDVPSAAYLGGTTFNVGAGATVNVNGGTFVGGIVFNVGQGAIVNLGSSTNMLSLSGTLTGSGLGTVELSNTVVIGLGGLTLNFPGDMLQWNGGALNASTGDVTNLGTVNLVGSTDEQIYADGTFDNFGTIIQTGTGNFDLHSDNVSPTTLKNEPGATYVIESNAGIGNAGLGDNILDNRGTIRKTTGGGTSTLYIPSQGHLSNTGVIEAESGTLYLAAASITQVSGTTLTTLTGGTWKAVGTATLQFPNNGTAIINSEANLILDGAGAAIAGLAGLSSNGGGFVVTDGATFTTVGNFTNGGSLTLGAGSRLAVTGNFTQTSTGTLNDQVGGTPGSGLFGRLAVSGTATLAGSFDVALVNGFSPSAGQDFGVISFASAIGNFASYNGLSPFFTEALASTSLNLDDAATDSLDLALTSVTAPTTANVGQSITVSWQGADQSSQATTGSWQDSVYLSATPTITSSSTLLGTVPQNSTVSSGHPYSASLTAPLHGLAPGFYYVLVQVDSLYQLPDPNRSNNTLAASTGLVNIGLPALTLGTAYADSFAAADQDNYYQVTVPAGGALSVALQSSALSGAVALYVGQGIVPTPYNYQQAAALANKPNQTAVVPQVLTAGTYYVLAHSISGAAATAGYTITATQTAAVSISAFAPNSGGNAGNVTIEIDGANFTPTTSASLTPKAPLTGPTINASSVDFVNASQLFATFNLAVPAAAVGGYTVSVQQGGQAATAQSTFQVVAVQGPALNVNLSLPQYVRSGRTGTVIITYTNDTANDIVAPILDISSTNANVLFSTPDDPNNYVQNAELLAVAPSGPAGILRPGQGGQLTLALLSTDTIDGDQIPVQVSQFGKGQTIDWASLESSLQPSNVPTAAWNVIYGNFLNMVGTTTDSYAAALAQAATYLSGLGETTAQVSDSNLLTSFLIAQASADFPLTTLTSTVDASLSTPGSLSLAVDRSFVSSIAGRYLSGIFGLGWTTSWQSALTVDGSGNVTITTGGALSYFPIQANGTYLDTAGEYGTLTTSGGIYTFTNTAGTQSVFLPNGLLNYQQDTNGNRITLGYNSQNQLVTLTYSNPSDPSEPIAQMTLTYNAQGFVSQVADGTGHIWSYGYDTAGHLLSVTAPGPTAAGLTTTYRYDPGSNPETANALLSITNPDGSQQNFTYDSLGRLSGTSANGGTLATTYGYLGQAEVEATDSGGNQNILWFNALGLPARVQDARGGMSSYLYDTNGSLIVATDPAGNSSQYTYDSNGNLTKSVNPLGQTVQMSYNSLSELTSMTDAQGNATQYNYSAAGNLLSIAYPDGTQRSFSYDPLGNLSETILQNGDPVNSQFNAQGLVTQENFADGTYQTYAYDAHGNMLTAQTYDSSGNLTGTITLTYNAAAELTSITYPNGQYLYFTYNAQGQRTQSVDQSGYTLTYGYDSLGRLVSLSDGSGMVVTYTYNSLGQLSEKQNGNGTYTTYAYDAAGNLTSEINYAGGSTVNSSFTYTYNVLNEITSITDAANNVTTYGYDSLGQLTQVTLPGGQSIIYVYNAAGDRTEVLDNGAATNYASNADNEITQVGSTTYTYDANGNLHTTTDASGTTTYNYNDQNKLVSIAASDGTVTTFQYSPLGFMTGMNVNGTQTNYLVDPTGLGNAVATYNGSGALIAHYSFGLGLASQTGPHGTGYYDFYGNGNTIGITGSSGTYVNQYSYLPFGETQTISAALPNVFQFVGQYGVVTAAAGLDVMRARNYVVSTGQFATNDPLGVNGGDTNIRRYAGNNPVTFVDPKGYSTLQNLGIVAGGLVLIAGGLYFGLAFTTVTCLGGAQFTSVALSNGGFAIVSLGALVVEGGAARQGTEIIDAQIEREKMQGHAELNAELARLSHLPRPPRAILVFDDDEDTENRLSQDPNALLGPAGYGTPGFIQPTGVLPYTIDFENDGSVAAQDVTVSEQLDPNLDWSTFQLGSFGFGAVNVTVSAGLTQYQTTVSYANFDGSPLNVLVSLNFNVSTGLLTATFTSRDPLTGQTPTGVFDGFLYANSDSPIGSNGFVQYTIHPKAGLSTGAAITQQASVVFDTNAPLATAQVVNTIDTGAELTSTVGSLPPTETSPTFTVNWSAQDPGGSGIASYSVYVKDNSGPFTPFLQDTTQTSATFTGVAGHTYGFFSIATDNVGNTLPLLTAAQTTTQVQTTQTITPTITVTGGTFNYNGRQHAASATATGVGGVPVSGTFTFTYNSLSTAPTRANSTPYTVVATFTSSNPQYSNASGSTTITINPIALTITANNAHKTYGQALDLGDSAFKAKGLVAGDTVTSVTLTSAGTAVTAATTHGGTPYPIVPSSAQGTGLSNYTITYVDGKLRVRRAQLTITADNAAKVYGQTLTIAGTQFTTSGLVTANGDSVTSVTLLSGGADPKASVSHSPYAIVASAAVGTRLSNYKIAYVSGALTVTPATPVIMVSGGPYLFDGNAHASTIQATGVFGENVAGSFNVTYNGSSTAPTKAGTYAVVVTFASGNANYGNAGGSGTLVINQATPKVKVTGGTFTYDGTAHPASATATGVDGVGVAGSWSFTFGGSTTLPVKAGTYAVVAIFTSTNTNYTGASGTGTITICQARLLISVNNAVMLAGNSPPPLTGTVIGLISGDNVTVSYTTTATSHSSAGAYVINAVVSGSAAPNYQVQITTGTLQVVTVGADTSASGGQSIAYWDSSANSKKITAKYLTALDQFHLVNGNGTSFVPTTAAALQSWLQNASASTNVAYRLSAQIADMELNVLAGFVKSTDIVYAGQLLPYNTATNPILGLDSGGFITIGNLLAEANAALCTTGMGSSSTFWVGYETALAQSLQAANANSTFVQQLVR